MNSLGMLARIYTAIEAREKEARGAALLIVLLKFKLSYLSSGPASVVSLGYLVDVTG
jgi:hypothetical protein